MCLLFSRTLIESFIFFFFSSRRRHTRFDCDWSSDVCSSDLTSPRARGASIPSPRTTALSPSQYAGWSTWNASGDGAQPRSTRSEEHTSELQSQSNLVCRLLLEKKKKKKKELRKLRQEGKSLRRT